MAEINREQLEGPYEHTSVLAKTLADDFLSRYQLETGIANAVPGTTFDPHMGSWIGLFRTKNGPKDRAGLVKLFEEVISQISDREALDALYKNYIEKEEGHPSQVGQGKALISKHIHERLDK